MTKARRLKSGQCVIDYSLMISQGVKESKEGSMEFRLLRAEEIDCRVAQAKSTGVSLLLYKDARCDMNILDETVGAFNWQRSHSRDNANCAVEIWDADKSQWISKEDTGTESNKEQEKGLASDSFKRACFNWGIGRELYTAPFIWITPDKCKIVQNGQKYACYDRFKVTEIGYDASRRINRLVITSNNKPVYTYGAKSEEQQATPSEYQRITQAHINTLRSTFDKHGIAEDKVLALYKLAKLDDATVSQFSNIMTHIDEVKGACAK